jgi:CubicO group peptidase (beta-lactamase class C family)
MKKSNGSGLTKIRTITAVSLVLILTGSVLWWYIASIPTRTEPSEVLPEEYFTYSGFGFSFKYPKGMVFSEGVLTQGFDHAHPYHGDIQGVLDQFSEIVGVVWLHSDDKPYLETSLDEFFESIIVTESFQDLSKSPFTSSQKDEYEMIYQSLEYKDLNDVSHVGFAGTWYNQQEQRVYTFYNSLPSRTASQTNMNERFLEYVETFNSTLWNQSSNEILDYWPTENWRYATPEAVDMNATLLNQMIEDIKMQNIGVDSVTIIRDGYVVADAYFPPFNEGELHRVYSCTKSLVSTLIGIALEEGYLESLEQKLTNLYYDKEIAQMSPWKEEITLKNLLTMTAGFDARDSWLYEWEWLDRMLVSIDAQQYVLDLQVIDKPGTRFEYTNGVSHLLSCIITETIGVTALEYAEKKLFEPLGIHDHEWLEDSRGRNWGWSTLSLTPHDMAKIGYLFLKQGEWNDETIISKKWVEEATMKHVDGNILPGYGYQWWVNPGKYFTAVGYGGQFIHVVPDMQLVVVVTSSGAKDFNYVFSLLEEFIIPAVLH